MTGSRQFRAALSELDEMMRWVREIVTKFALPIKANKMELAIEEAIVNVIHYAYPSYPPGVLELSYCQSPDKFDFIVKDQGIAFNPLENPKPYDPNSPIEEREIGGLGIHFILKMTDSSTYQRSDGWNVLTLTQLY